MLCRTDAAPPATHAHACACTQPATVPSGCRRRAQVRWRYWAPVNDPTGKDKRKKRAVDIWCEGEVVKIANGTTDKEDPDRATCKKLAQAGAVRVKWPADAERDEEESFN
eukprot:1741392-Prymnesium_polylepis.1